jgi:hypothetical protein
MFKKLFLSGVVIAGVISVMAENGMGQSVFRVGAWCFRQAAPQPDPVYFNTSANEWRVKGHERDKLLNIGFNYFIGCVVPIAEDALVFMGDSLNNAPVRKEFESTLEWIPPNLPYFPPATFPNGIELWRFSRTAQLYNVAPTWDDSVTTGAQAMYNRHVARINGVHSFLVAAEGCINQGNKFAGINFMCDNTVIDAFVQLGYVPPPPTGCNTQTTYQMAKRLVRADHLMSGGYVFYTSTPQSGPGLQSQIDYLVGGLGDAARGIKDSVSIARLWAVLQTQQSTYWQFRLPTKAEILCTVNLSLAYGAKGIAFYPYATIPAPQDESGLLNANRDTTTQYNNVRDINTNYQGTGQSLVTIGGNFLNLTWKEGVTIHQNLNEPINSTYKLYDVTAKPPSGADDAENQTYVEVGILQNASSVNHYMVVNRRCLTSETREVTVTFQANSNNAYRLTDVYTGGTTTCYVGSGITTFCYALTLGPGQGKLLIVEDLGYWSSTITSNTTWSGNICVNANVTVNSGVTLTVSPGTTVKFASARKLTVNGRLVADSNDPTKRITFIGTTATPGFWNGIIINANANASTLRRCDVQYATDGMTINYNGYSNNVTVDKCKIRDHGYNGIYINGNNYSGVTVHPTISNSTIAANESSGLYLINNAMPTITGNRIQFNTLYGIEASSNSSATVTYNYIAGNTSYGVMFAYSSLAALHRNTIESNVAGGVYTTFTSNVTAYGADTTKGRNRIRLNSGEGIYASNSSPFFGYNISGQYGNNWISGNSSYEARQAGSGMIWAEQCYWSGQQTDVTGSVDTSPTLSSAPSPVGWGKSSSYDPTLRAGTPPAIIATLVPEDIQYSLSASTTMAKTPQSGATINWTADLQAAIAQGLATGDWSVASELITALHRELQNASVPDVDFALVNTYANNLAVAAFIRKMLALVLMEKELAGGNIAAALEKLSAFGQSNAEHAAELLANTGLIHLFRQKDLTAAQNILEQLQTLAKNGDATAIEHVNLFGRILADYQRRQDLVTDGLAKAITAPPAALTPATTPALTQNYPNPFNPETTIRFYLNERQKVRLTIFDLAGHRVRTVVEDELPAGEQTLSWDGRDEQGRSIASGVYFYELAMSNKVERKKMTLVR